jgi:hypothetical protein
LHASAASDSTGLGELMDDLDDVTATLTFLEDGLDPVVTVQRK